MVSIIETVLVIDGSCNVIGLLLDRSLDAETRCCAGIGKGAVPIAIATSKPGSECVPVWFRQELFSRAFKKAAIKAAWKTIQSAIPRKARRKAARR